MLALPPADYSEVNGQAAEPLPVTWDSLQNMPTRGLEAWKADGGRGEGRGEGKLRPVPP